MNEVSKTLYIPLYGKALVSKMGIFIDDKKAEEIWEKEQFELKRKSKSKWLAYNMGIRAAVFDNWVKEKMKQHPEAVILHLGCGMDSRVERIGTQGHKWFDVDFPNVIQERMKYYQEDNNYMMFGADASKVFWITELPKADNVILIMEGISMYLTENQITDLFMAIQKQYGKAHIIMDCYTTFSAKVSKWKNPINDVGVRNVYGIDEPRIYEKIKGVSFTEELDMVPKVMVKELPKNEQTFFKFMFTGRFVKKIYRLFIYEIEKYE